MTDEELIARMRWRRDSLDAKAADRIEALTEQLAATRQYAKEAGAYAEELQEVIDRQAALLADAYGADLDWEEVLKQRADHEAVKRIEALTEQRDKAWQNILHWRNKYFDLEEKLALMTTERDEAWKRASYVEKMWGEAEVNLAENEVRLRKAVEALGMLVRDCEADYPPSHGAIKHFAIATLAEIKGESHE